MIKRPQSRRRVIAQALSVLGLGLVPSWSFGRQARSQPSTTLAERMASLLGPRASAAHVGRAYLGSIPREQRNAEYMEHEVCAPRCAVEAVHDLAVEDLHPRLRAWIADDFRRGSVVTVEGWILSRTEAALAGLAATLETDAKSV